MRSREVHYVRSKHINSKNYKLNKTTTTKLTLVAESDMWNPSTFALKGREKKKSLRIKTTVKQSFIDLSIL